MTTPKPMKPEEVLEIAQRAEQRAAQTEVHPVYGVIGDDVEILDDDPARAVRLEAMPPPPPAPRRPKTYCDSCGYVDAHAPDCPQQVAEDMRREEAREIALERAEQLESIPGLLRKLGATILRKLAKRIEGE